MDLNEYWQENKRFVTLVALGLLVFLVAQLSLKSTYQGGLNEAKLSISAMQRGLRNTMHTASQRDEAQRQNDELRAAVEALSEIVEFQARPDFRLDPAQGSGSNQYLRALTRVRDDLIPRANRANLEIEDGLGMPRLSPTREEEIERYLEALDVIDTIVRYAIDTRVQRLDRIQIRLDSDLSSHRGLGRIERTRVHFTLTGSSLAMTRLLTRTQRGGDGRVLHIDELELTTSRNKDDELRLELGVLIARLHEPAEQEG